MPRDGTATRTKILDAAVALADGGIDAITIEALTTTSGAANGSIYHHFGSRQGVLVAAVDRAFAGAMAAAAPALDRRPAPEAIADFVARYVAWVRTHRREATILYGAPLALDPGEVSSAKQASFAPVVAWLVERMGRGEVPAIDLDLVDPIAFGPVHETCRRWLAHPGAFDLDATVPSLIGAVTAILV